MSNFELQYLERLDNALGERFGKEPVCLNDVPDWWVNYPLVWLHYGARNGCIREISPMWSGDDVMSDIINLFYFYYRSLIDYLAERKNIDPFGEFSIGLYIQPDYLNQSTIIITQRMINHLVCIKEMKAWHLTFETPEAMDTELKEEFELIVANVRS